MKKHHTTILLLVLFFTGLIVLWWAQYADVPTSQELRERVGLLLPQLRNVMVSDIQRIEIIRHREGENGKASAQEKTAFERRDGGWQMVEPVNVAADSARLELLAQNLKNIRSFPDAGTIHEKKPEFGLAPPRVTIELYRDPKTRLAALDVGRAVRDRLYVQPVGETGIEVVDARLFTGIDQPAPAWRDRALFNLATFQVSGFKVTRPGHVLEAARLDGQWKIVKPIQAVADDFKVESALGELTSVRVAEGEQGFVANDVSDLGRYGLKEGEAIRIELDVVLNRMKPQVAFIGSPVPDHPDLYYARRGDQDDVIMIEGREIHKLGVDKNALRGNKVADFKPEQASFIRIKAHETVFELSRSASGWELMKPVHEPADPQSVPALLPQLAELQTSEFLDQKKVVSPGVESPFITLELWQRPAQERVPSKPSTEPKGDPAVVLKLGRHDILRKTVFALAKGDDETLLALPDAFLNVLPKNQLAFRSRAVLTLGPAKVQQLSIEHDGQTTVLAPDTAGRPNQWKMVSPIEALADETAVTKALAALSNLRAERLITDAKGNEKAFGLDKPLLVVSWTVPPDNPESKGETAPLHQSLRVGAKVPTEEARYATVTGSPYVFTLMPVDMLPFYMEFRTRQVFSFRPSQVSRLVLRWPDKTLAFSHRPTRRGGPTDWTAEPGTPAGSFDFSRLDAIVTDLSRYQTRMFAQYVGPFPTSAGLAEPRLIVELHMKGAPTQILRIGSASRGGEFFATTEKGSKGAIFLLSGSGWTDLLGPATRGELPDDVFAPAPAAPKSGH